MVKSKDWYPQMMSIMLRFCQLCHNHFYISHSFMISYYLLMFSHLLSQMSHLYWKYLYFSTKLCLRAHRLFFLNLFRIHRHRSAILRSLVCFHSQLVFLYVYCSQFRALIMTHFFFCFLLCIFSVSQLLFLASPRFYFDSYKEFDNKNSD